jgi:hypothetical protein
MFFRRPTLVEFLVLATCVAIAIALLLPAVEMAADGEYSAKIRVYVYDMTTDEPLPNATVRVYRHMHVMSDRPLSAQSRDWVPDTHGTRRESATRTTDHAGEARLDYPVRTRWERGRESRARLNWVGIEVQAEGYGSTRFQLSPGPVLIPDLKVRGEIIVPVGLSKPAEAVHP